MRSKSNSRLLNEHSCTSSISNKYIKEMITNEGLSLRTYKDLIGEKREKKEKFLNNSEKLRNLNQRKWMNAHQRDYLIDFTEKDLKELKSYFKQLDEEKNNSIGITQLETPLMSLGIAENAEDIKKIISTVDKDGSGQIEFGEFLGIIKAKNDSSKKDSLLINFFKDMISGNLADGKISKSLPFQMVFDAIRRRKLMDAILASDLVRKEEGERVRKCFENKMPLKKLLKVNKK